MELEIADFIEESILICLEDVKDFQYISLIFGERKASVTIQEDNVLVDLNFPIKSIKERSEITVEEFHINVPIRLGKLLDIKDEIISEFIEHDDIELSKLASYDAEIDILPYDGPNTIYSIYDTRSYMNASSYVFNFAVRSSVNIIPAFNVTDIPSQTAYVGEEFKYIVDVLNPSQFHVEFTDNTMLFNINADLGEIRFTPMVIDVGFHEIEITVVNKHYTQKKTFMLEVKEQ